MYTHKQILLIILDGWGYSTKVKYNAIVQAKPEFMNYLWENYPHALFEASGEAVGLPQGNIGTSEIGHTILGSGRIIYTDMLRVNKAIESGEFNNNIEFKNLFDHVKKNSSTLHIMGLVSPGGVHSHQAHLFSFLRLANENEIKKIVVHVFTDGRDTSPRSGAGYVEMLEQEASKLGKVLISTVHGRYYAMDRDKNWDRTQRSFDALFNAIGEKHSGKSASEIIREQYDKDINDEFIPPQILLYENGNPETINKNDGLFFINFRPDRARQITKKILEKVEELNLYFVTLTNYDSTLKTHVAFPPLEINKTLSEILATAGISQAHIAETEKYAHITYFFNGIKEIVHKNEKQILIDSRKDISTHDLAPEMRAKEIADATIEQINKNVDFIVINFANADMVGHTGKWEPTLEGIKFEDEQIKRVTEAMLSKNGMVLITADHGNAEEMYDETARHPITAHSLYPVPFIITDNNVTLRENGTLADVAPTILKLLSLPIPPEMTGQSLIL